MHTEIYEEFFEGTVAEIIERLQKLPQDAKIYQSFVMQGNGMIDADVETVLKYFIEGNVEL